MEDTDCIHILLQICESGYVHRHHTRLATMITRVIRLTGEGEPCAINVIAEALVVELTFKMIRAAVVLRKSVRWI